MNGQLFDFNPDQQVVELVGLVADGNPVDVVARFTAAPNCSMTKTNQFTAPDACSACIQYSSTTLMEISSSIPNSVNSTIMVNEDLIISDLNVVDLIGSHTYIGDLQMSLTSPDGTTVVIMESGDCTEDDFNMSFDDDALMACLLYTSPSPRD